MRNQVEEVIDGVIDIISFQLQMILKEEMPKILASQVKRNSAASVKLTEYLSLLCQKLDKPLLLFIDEIDALVGDSLVSVLRQLRSGYDLRPQAFPQSIILCGVRDVRDYRIVLSNQDIVTGGSAFNIKAESLRWGISPVKKFISFICSIGGYGPGI